MDVWCTDDGKALPLSTEIVQRKGKEKEERGRARVWATVWQIMAMIDTCFDLLWVETVTA